MSTYDPSLGTTSNKSYAVTGKPDGFRTYYADPSTGIQRPYQNKAEVLAWFDAPAKRIGQFDIVINTGGTLSFGVIIGGTNEIYYFKNGQSDGDLVLKFGAEPVLIPYSAGSADPFFVDSLQTRTSIDGVSVSPASFGAFLDFKVILQTGSVQIYQPNLQPLISFASGLPDTVTIPFGSGGSVTLDDYIILVTKK